METLFYLILQWIWNKGDSQVLLIVIEVCRIYLIPTNDKW
jgi:hypothetical protein